MVELASETKSSLLTIFDRRVLVLLAFTVFIWSMRFVGEFVGHSIFYTFAFLHILPECFCLYFLGENLRRFFAVINASLTEILVTALAISAGIISFQVCMLMVVRGRTRGLDFMMFTLTTVFLLSYYIGYFLYKKEVQS